MLCSHISSPLSHQHPPPAPPTSTPHLKMATGESRSFAYLLQRISVAVQVGNALSIIATIPDSVHCDFDYYMYGLLHAFVKYYYINNILILCVICVYVYFIQFNCNCCVYVYKTDCLYIIIRLGLILLFSDSDNNNNNIN